MAVIKLRWPVERNSAERRAFTVEWNMQRGRFVALDDDRNVLGTSVSQNSAIALAIRDANLASRSGNLIMVRVLQQNGEFRNEHIACPPPVL